MKTTEKLIDLVKPHPCLYNTKDRHYRHTYKKDMIWEKISKALNQNCDETKAKWKNLKDSYVKYKKDIKDTTGQKRKYLNWTWAPYLSFLDCIPERKVTSSDILKPAETQADDFQMDETLSLDMLHEPLQRPESPHTALSETSTTSLLETLPTPPISLHSASKKIKPPKNDMDKVLNYLKNKRKKDAVDLLFSSYAESFKKLKLRTQAEVKLKMAQIFIEAELKDLDSENEVAEAMDASNLTSRGQLNFECPLQFKKEM
ncbi:uncharacterized protein LOC114349977 [Ostrinia furnacalis]|uniref:uncharacterized protein LOC114349977 n=1 Tax=Ostrinia furnacalis TaxID=93504 RepID=UPI00103F2C01|nr:uncharacterized protein LOC114349977 [Ostrinia furnacalis]